MPVCDKQIQRRFYQAISTMYSRTHFCTSCPIFMFQCVLSHKIKMRENDKIKYSINSTHHLTVL
jgi:ribosomal protein S26